MIVGTIIDLSSKDNEWCFRCLELINRTFETDFDELIKVKILDATTLSIDFNGKIETQNVQTQIWCVQLLKKGKVLIDHEITSEPEHFFSYSVFVNSHFKSKIEDFKMKQKLDYLDKL